jgi:integrase
MGKKAAKAGSKPRGITPYTRQQVTWFLERTLRVDDGKHAWLHDFFQFAFRKGQRSGELIELRWADFSDVEPLVHIQRSFTYRVKRQKVFDAKTGRLTKTKVAEGRVTTPKNGRTRWVRLDSEDLTTLKARRKAMREAALKRGQPMTLDALVFPALEGGRIISGNVQKRSLDRICSEPCIDEDGNAIPKLSRITMHVFRHTHVTSRLVVEGRNALPDISEQIGHKDPETTERHYAHWMLKHKDKLDQVDRAVARGMAKRPSI